MTTMLEPEIIPIGGFNLEYRQNSETSQGYIYAHAGAGAADFQSTYEKLPDTISFNGRENSPDKFTHGTIASGTMQISSVIHPYPCTHFPSLPSSLTLKAGDEIVDFLLIAKVNSMTYLFDVENPPANTLARWQKAEIGRHTVQTLHAGGVLQELVGAEGERYMLVSAFGETVYDANAVDGLNGMPLPEGYTYESKLIEENMTIEALEVAHIIINPSYNFQLY
ncbi:MAG: hypothetical protein HRT35_08200 [Algicola sp.]|nr:hypothetical protein [Algicola sp.]